MNWGRVIMRRSLLVISLLTLLLASCSLKSNNQEDFVETPTIIPTEIHSLSPTTIPTTPAISPTQTATLPTQTASSVVINSLDGSVQLDLNDTASVVIKSISISQGIIISGRYEVDQLAKSFTKFKAYDESKAYANQYDYSLSFLSKEEGELVTIKIYTNKIISINDKLYFDEADQIGMNDIRKLYINKIKKSFKDNDTGFELNGVTYSLKDRDIRITSLEKNFLLSKEDTEPRILLIGSSDRKESYFGVFDVEKLDYVVDAFGTNIIWKDDPANSLVYTHDNSVYNIQGNVIFENKDQDYSISSLKFDEEMYTGVVITLKNSNNETKEIKRLNYKIAIDEKYINEQKDLGLVDTVGEFEADLSQDGISEKLKISKSSNGNSFAILEVMDSADNILLMDQAHTSHVGWNSIYLCKINGLDYLFVFNPYSSTGFAEFMYSVYRLNQAGTLTILDSAYFCFDYGARTKGTAFDEDGFIVFADKVNYYLNKSYLLISTENGELIYSTYENKITDFKLYQTDKWLKVTKSLLY